MFPATLPLHDDPIVGAASVHRLFKSWLAAVSSGEIESGVSEQVTAVIALATMAATVPGAADHVLRATKHENPIVRGAASAALERMGR